MSDAHHDHGHGHQDAPAGEIPPLRLVSSFTDGGHEIDTPPNKNLFGFLAVLVIILIVAAIGVYQLFVTHTGNQLTAAASVPPEQLMKQKAHEADFASTWGKVVKDGQTTYRMPYAEAKRLVVSNPEAFKPAPPPPGWVHPNDAK